MVCELLLGRTLSSMNPHKILNHWIDVFQSIAPQSALWTSITNSIIRLAQKGRAAGLHVILATQRPSVDVISGIIKSNFPMRIAFRVASRVDSMTILDAPGAEKLIGRGDMLFSAGIDSERIQCGFIDGKEIDAITDFIGAQIGYGRCYNTPYYLPAPEEPGAEGGEGGGMVARVAAFYGGFLGVSEGYGSICKNAEAFKNGYLFIVERDV